MSWVDTLFGGGQSNAARSMQGSIGQGMNNTSQLFDQGRGYLNPFMQREPILFNQYMSTINQGQDPSKLYNQFASSYQESPEALAMNKVGQTGANNAAAASGMLGSGAEQTAAANLSQSVRATDFDKYMKNMFGIRDQYLTGVLGQQQEGYGAATTAANMSAQEAQIQQKYYEDQANARAAEQEGDSGDWTHLLGRIAGGIGGFALGGPGGAAMGASAGGNIPWFDPDTNQSYQQR
mgnify:CR=1 FL=1